jgi:hypothetical protein
VAEREEEATRVEEAIGVPSTLAPLSPLPWHVGPHYKTDIESSQGRVAEIGFINSPHGICDAAYIVHACNLYPELLAALKQLHDVTMQGLLPCDSDCEPGCVFCVATRAIAKAEGVTHGR